MKFFCVIFFLLFISSIARAAGYCEAIDNNIEKCRDLLFAEMGVKQFYEWDYTSKKDEFTDKNVTSAINYSVDNSSSEVLIEKPRLTIACSDGSVATLLSYSGGVDGLIGVTYRLDSDKSVLVKGDQTSGRSSLIMDGGGVMFDKMQKHRVMIIKFFTRSGISVIARFNLDGITELSNSMSCAK